MDTNNIQSPLYCPNCTLTPWKKQMMRLTTDSKFHDVSFIVGTGNKRVKIGCNRSLLSIHCPVFAAMFESSMLESSSRCVEIHDIKPVVFAAMLQWMSTDTLNISSICDLSELIALADKYQMHGLLDSCRLFLKHNTITIHVITDSILSQYHGFDLGLNNLKQMSIKLRILLYSSVTDIIMAIAKQLNWNTNLQNIKIWRVSNRKNGTIRPNRYLSPNMDIIEEKEHEKNKKNEEEDDADDHSMDLDVCEATNHLLFDINSMKCGTCYAAKNTKIRSNHKKTDWNPYCGDNPTKAIYARLCNKDESENKSDTNMIQMIKCPLLLSQSFAITQSMQNVQQVMNNNNNNKNNEKNGAEKILLFLKYYDVYNEYLSMICSILVDKTGSIASICDIIREIAHWSEEHEILLFEEEDYNSNKINPIDLDQNISDTSLVDGDIIVFQEKSKIFSNLQLINVKSFFQREMNKRKMNHTNAANQRIRRNASSSNSDNNNNHMIAVDQVDDTFII